MRCISPILIKTADRRDYVPCGKCNFCLQNRRNDWSFRLAQELKTSYTSKFLTLTYEEENIIYHESSGLPTISKRDIQLFTKRIRKQNARMAPWPLRYYTVGEYGTETARPHYHALIFNLHYSLLNNLQDFWTAGQCHIGDVNPASIHYVTKYHVNCVGEYPGRSPPFALMSKKPGIGSNYLTTHFNYHKHGKNHFTKVNGQVGRLPRFYKEKIFTKTEKQSFARQSMADFDNVYEQTISALSGHSIDPHHYYDERVRWELENITHKENRFNTH